MLSLFTNFVLPGFVRLNQDICPALPRKTHVYGYVSKRTINVTSNATVAAITVLFSVAERFAHKVVTLKDVTLNAAVKIVIRGVMGE